MPLHDVLDASLFYEQSGQGTPILWIQGTGVCGSGWGPQVREFSKDHRCLWFDNRGFGKSVARGKTLTIEQMASDARALMDLLKWESAHVVGHSMGGLIAQQLALDVPSRVRSLSLLCTFAKGAEAARITPAVAWMGLQTRVGTRAMRRRGFLKMLFPQDYLQSQNSEQLAAKVGELIGRDLADSPPIMMRQLAAMRAHDMSSRLSDLSRISTLVSSADQDPIALTEYGKGLHGRIAGSKYVEIAGASHGVTIQMPERINALLREHFARTS